MTESISRKFSRLGLGVSETGTLTVNSATATKWATARTLTLSGDLSGNVSIDGSDNVTLTATVSGNTVALGTDTTGDYVASVTAGTGITTTGTGEGAAVTVAIDSTVTTLTGSQTLTNKTISGSNNTITNIGNGSLTNSSITINGASIALGASATLVTDDVAEDASPVNLWFTNTRARNAVSATDAGGDGSFTYDSGTGVFTYTGPSATEVRAHLSAGTGLTYTTGQFSIDSTVATLTGTQTLSNKTLTSPVISSINNTGTLTLPTSTDTLVGRATTDTLTNKTISGADNTISNIGNASLTNSSITINGTSVSLGGTRTLVTDDIAEDGSPTNLWYTDARTRSAISVSDTGGDGSLSYNSGTGVITYTGPSASEVRAHFSAGTGVTISSGQISIGQAVATTDNVTFAGVTVDNIRVGVTAVNEIDTSTGNLVLDSTGGTTTIDDNATITGNLQVDGNLTVSGTTVTMNTTTLSVEDNMIYLNSGSAVANPDLGFAGNYNDGTYRHAGVFRDATDGVFKFFHQYTPEPDAAAYIDTTHGSFALAPIQASTFTGNVTGDVTGNASTATTWQTARTLTLTGDVTGTSASFNGSGNISISTTIAADSVALGTDTTGNYVASITNGNYITGGNGGSEGAALTLAVDATSANTASKVVARDASGNFSAGTITATLSGNASTVTNGVYTTDTGTVTNTMLAGSIANNKLANSTISGVALGSNLGTLTLGVSGTGLSGSQTYNGSGAATFTVTSNATSANTASTIVARDASGNFTAGTITAALSGNATSATTAGTITSQANSATITATSANTANQIVLRDGSGNFSAGTITATLNGNANGATTVFLQSLGSGSVNVNNGNLGVYRNENGSGAALAYAPVLHVGGGDTMWQIQGTYGTSGNGTFYFRQGYNGSWGTWLTMLSDANYNSYAPTLTGTGASGTWGISISGNAATATSATTAGALTSMNISQFTNNSGYITGLSFDGLSSKTGGTGTYTTTGDFRAPIFYDSNNTGYYTDPASTSVVNQINLAGYLRRTSSGAGYLEGNYSGAENGSTSGAIYTIGGSYQPGTTSLGNMYGVGYTVGNGTSNPGLGSTGWGFYVASAGTSRIFLDSDSGIGRASGDWRAPIFYDSNDTAFYLNPAGGSRLRNLYVGDSGDDWSDPGGWGTQIRFSNGPHVKFVLHARSPGIEAGMYVHTPSSVYIGSYSSHDVSLMYAGSRKMGFNASYIYTDVYLEAAGSLRAPIFYDSNNTGYYVNPDSTTYLYNLELSGAAYFKPNTWIQFNGGYGLYWPNNYGAHLYPNDGSTYTQLRLNGSKNSYGGIWDSYSAVAGIMYDSSGNGGVYREANSRWYFYYHLGNDCMGIGTSSTSSTYSLYLNKGVYAQSRVDATIFYDTNNTGYYCDPNGTARLSYVVANGGIRIDGNEDLYLDYNYGCSIVGVYSSYRYQGVFSMGNSYKLARDGTTTGNLYGMAWSHPNAGGVAGNLNDHGLLVLTNGGWCASLTGSTRARDDMRAPIFYDNNNTGYYIDPTSTTAIRTVGSWRADSASWDGEFAGKIQYHASNWYFQYASQFIFRNSGGGNVFYGDTSGNVWSYAYRGNGNVGGTGEASWHPSGIYSGSTQWLYGNLYRNGAGTYDGGVAYYTIMYDTNDTGYYCNPASTSYMYRTIFQGRMLFYGADQSADGTNDAQIYFTPGGGLTIASITTSFETGFVGSSYPQNRQVGAQATYDKRFYVWQDLVQYYSDERLKEKTGTLAGALDAIKSWTPFKYVDNALANSFNFGSDKPQIGLSAQEVQQFYPELVELAPFDVQNDFSDETNPRRVSKSGENYLTLNYTRLVPVLVQAIKEQQAKIEELENRINNS